MAEETLLNLLSNVAAPVLICLYTLFGVNKTLNKQDETFKDLTVAINKLSSDIDKRLDKIEEKTRELQFKIEHMHRGE